MNQAVSGGTMNSSATVRSWMIDKEESISIPAKACLTNLLDSDSCRCRILGAVVILIPAALVIGGGVVWFSRSEENKA